MDHTAGAAAPRNKLSSFKGLGDGCWAAELSGSILADIRDVREIGRPSVIYWIDRLDVGHGKGGFTADNEATRKERCDVSIKY